MYQEKLIRMLAVGTLVLGVSACTTTNTAPVTDSRFDDCRQDAVAQADQAASGNSAALYHAAARNLRYCVGLAIESSDPDDVMRTQALVVTNYFKAGDVNAASEALGEFRDQFAGEDLYFADGSSFIDNMALLLGEFPESAANRGSLVNAKSELKSEIRRVQYWQTN